ncbi:MAG: FAD-binding protein [Deltaproteobacteria bacterium]|nr:FAD-binding protein [Deltaproteobacteria bacterium]
MTSTHSHLSPEGISELSKIVGQAYCRTGRLDLELYSYDSSPFIHFPEVLVLPGTVEEVAAITALCHRRHWPLTARGAGTSLSGGAVSYLGGVAMSLTRLDRILEIDPIEETVLVEAGVVNLALQNVLARQGFMFPPDPASQKASTIGGNIAENAGGIKGVKYGITKHHVLGLELILDDGSTVKTGALAQGLDAVGPDLTGIFMASEGTLAMVVRALLKITPLPNSFRTVSAVFDDLERSGKAVSAIIAAGIIPTALEIMDHRLIVALEDYLHLGFPTDAEAMLLIELDGLGPELDGQYERILTLCREAGAVSLAQAATPEERDKIWLARRSGNGAMGRIKQGCIVQDVTVPVVKLPSMLSLVQKVAKKYDVIIVQMAHAGDGNLHPHLLYDLKNEEEYKRCLKASAEIFREALAAGGAITGEHGIGLEKVEFMNDQFNEAELDFMGAVKRAMDPDGIFNPGKLLPERWQTWSTKSDSSHSSDGLETL